MKLVYLIFIVIFGVIGVGFYFTGDFTGGLLCNTIQLLFLGALKTSKE